MKLSHDHYPILSKTQVRKIIETHIPEEVRPFVHTIEIKPLYDEGLTLVDTDILVGFLPPVITDYVDDARYIQGSLKDVIEDLKFVEVDESSIGDECYADWDDGIEDKKPLKTKKHKIDFEWSRKFGFVKEFSIKK